MLSIFYEWSNWEGILHMFLFVLTLLNIFFIYFYKKERTITNYLLFTIIIALDVIIHQNINMQNNKQTNYL